MESTVKIFFSCANWFFDRPFALFTARHLGFDRAEPRPGAIFMRLVFCHGPPFSNPPSRASIQCNIHEVCLLSRPANWDNSIRCNIHEKMADSWLKRMESLSQKLLSPLGCFNPRLERTYMYTVLNGKYNQEYIFFVLFDHLKGY